jgi:predicted ArsR family transcriptional regulator
MIGTVKQFAEKLNVSENVASKRLQKLEAAGKATAVGAHMTGKRGRPALIFEVTFNS